MTSQPLISAERASRLRVLAIALTLLAGIVAALVVALWEPVADFLGEGGIRVFDVQGGTRRGLITAILVAATLVGGHALWNWRGVRRYGGASVAAIVGFFAAGPLALPAITFGLAFVAIEMVAPLDRTRLADAGPRQHPLAWAAGVVVGAGAIAVAAYLTWFLVSPLLDEGTELDESLAFVLATPTASATAEVTQTAEPTADSGAVEGTATATPAPSEQPLATLISRGELMGADSFHFGSGDVLVIRDPDGNGVLRFEDYEVRNGPDIHVYLTPDAGGDVHVDGAIDLGSVRATRGNVNYELPPEADLESFRAAVIYCVPFQVVFATAELSGP